MKIILAGVIVLSFALFFFLKEAAPKTNFDSITNGMTAVETLQLLGDPLSISQDGPDTRIYFYGGFKKFRWCSMEVIFDADGRVKGKFHDH